MRRRWTARTPWIVWAAVMLLLLPTIALAARNGSFGEDPVFVATALMMVAAYSSVGAVVASRASRNPIGWLLIAVGVVFMLVGLSSEYLKYAYVTDPGSLPAASAAALVSTLFWLPTFVAIILLALLFPTGRVPSRRWRLLPPLTVALAATALVAGVFYPGPLDVGLEGVTIVNPIGAESLRPVVDTVATIAWIGVLMIAAPLSILALILRYRRSRGEERQQIRWLAYMATTIAAVVVVSIAFGLILGDRFVESVLGDVLFFAALIPIGIGVPAAVGVAILKHRLYDLDLVVKKTVLYAFVASVLVTGFAWVALTVGAIVGRRGTGAVVAAAVIGLSFWPVVRLARRVADRIVYGRRATPYEVLAEFSSRVGASYRDEDVLSRMAQILSDAVGAERATVWLRVGGLLRPSATWPGTEEPPQPVPATSEVLPPLGADTAVEVRDRGELLGALTVSMPPNDPLTPSKERLVRDLAAQAGLVLRNVRLIEELRASRQRLVTAQDQERRRIERNIHDGAQQQLVALTVRLRLAQTLLPKDPAQTDAMLTEVLAQTSRALEDLRDLARGIYPPLLADRGLREAVEAQARKSLFPVRVDADGIGRYPQEVEAAVYFCTLEALQNVAKYASASSVEVRFEERDGLLEFAVRDDGVGFDPAAARGSGLTNMRDRMDALGGSLDLQTERGAGTTVRGWLPVAGPVGSS